MNKKLIAIAIAGAVAAPLAAHADVTIYGKMHASWDWVTVDRAPGAGDKSDDVTGNFRASRLGFKGDEDLGNGLKAIWQVETQVNTGGGSLGLRDTFVGLAGNWGTVLLGRHDTPYKMSTASLDLFADTVGDYNNIIGRMAVATSGGIATAGATSFDIRVPQTVAYVTPNFNGFTGAIARVSTVNPDPAPSDNSEAWSAMGMYDNGPFFVSLAWEQHSGAVNVLFPGAGGTSNKIDAWKLGAAYTFGDSKVGGVYEDISDDMNNSPSSRKAWMLNFSHAFGANVLKVQYAKADDSDVPGSNDGANNWTLGVDHNFSKRTTVYALYSQTDNSSGGMAYGLTAGSDVGAANWGVGKAGGSADAFSVGIIHKF